MRTSSQTMPNAAACAAGEREQHREQQDDGHVVHYCCPEQGYADPGTQHPKFEQSLSRDADAGGGQEHAYENAANEIEAKGEGCCGTHEQGDGDAQQAGEEHGLARPPHLREVHLEPGNEHQKMTPTSARCESESPRCVSVMNGSPSRLSAEGPKQYPGEQLTQHGRLPDPGGEQTGRFGSSDYDGHHEQELQYRSQTVPLPVAVDGLGNALQAALGLIAATLRQAAIEDVDHCDLCHPGAQRIAAAETFLGCRQQPYVSHFAQCRRGVVGDANERGAGLPGHLHRPQHLRRFP